MTKSLSAFVRFIEAGDSVLNAFSVLRDDSTEELWNQLNDDPLVANLLDALSELEYQANN